MNRRFRFVIILLIIGSLAIGLVSIMRMLDRADNNIVDISPGIEEEDEAKPEPQVFKYTIDSLNLRTGPGTNKDIILTIPRGETVEVLGHDNGWDKIIYNGEAGYSSSDYLSDSPIEDDPDNGDDELEIIVSPETMKVVKGILLVNKEYALPMGYDPGEDPVAKEYLDKMIAAFYEETGKTLTAYSGYRSYEYQKSLFNRYVEKDGYDNAVMYSAKPRHSEHESGLAYDIGGSDQSYWLEKEFEATEEGIWLRDNGHRFGFILRYPKDKTYITGYIYEPWHFRYIGIEHATNVYEMDITLEEYLLDDN